MAKIFECTLLGRFTRVSAGGKLIVVSLATAGILLLGGAPAQARQSGNYRFTTILDSQRDGLTPTRCAAINNSGTIAIQVQDDALGFNKLVTKRGATDAPVVVTDTRAVADFPTFCDNGITAIPSDPSINELGEVAFQGNLRRLARADCVTGRRQGVFLGKAGTLTTIAHTINPPGGNFIAEFLVADQSANSLGEVAIVPELDLTFDHGLFVGSRSGTFDQRFLADHPTPDGFDFNNLSSRVSLNELGQIAFESGLNASSVSGIFLSNPNGTFRTIVDNSGGLEAADPSLNIFGRVAFTASRFDENFNQIFSINTSRGAEISTVAESSPRGYAFFDEPSLNDLGAVVFTADLDAFGRDGRQLQGVFTGPNPKTDKVLQTGDRYEGVRVTSVSTCSEALNDLGEIVMTVQSENPDTFEVRTFIVKATPRD